MRREIAIILILIAIVVAIAGCIRKPQEGGIAATKIKIGVMPDEATLPYYVAAQE